MFGDNNNQLAIALQPLAHYICGCSTWLVVTQVACGLSQHVAPKIQTTDSRWELTTAHSMLQLPIYTLVVYRSSQQQAKTVA